MNVEIQIKKVEILQPSTDSVFKISWEASYKGKRIEGTTTIYSSVLREDEPLEEQVFREIYKAIKQEYGKVIREQEIKNLVGKKWDEKNALAEELR